MSFLSGNKYPVASAFDSASWNHNPQATVNYPGYYPGLLPCECAYPVPSIQVKRYELAAIQFFAPIQYVEYWETFLQVVQGGSLEYWDDPYSKERIDWNQTNTLSFTKIGGVYVVDESVTGDRRVRTWSDGEVDPEHESCGTDLGEADTDDTDSDEHGGGSFGTALFGGVSTERISATVEQIDTDGFDTKYLLCVSSGTATFSGEVTLASLLSMLATVLADTSFMDGLTVSGFDHLVNNKGKTSGALAGSGVARYRLTFPAFSSPWDGFNLLGKVTYDVVTRANHPVGHARQWSSLFGGFGPVFGPDPGLTAKTSTLYETELSVPASGVWWSEGSFYDIGDWNWAARPWQAWDESGEVDPDELPVHPKGTEKAKAYRLRMRVLAAGDWRFTWDEVRKISGVEDHRETVQFICINDGLGTISNFQDWEPDEDLDAITSFDIESFKIERNRGTGYQTVYQSGAWVAGVDPVPYFLMFKKRDGELAGFGPYDDPESETTRYLQERIRSETASGSTAGASAWSDMREMDYSGHYETKRVWNAPGDITESLLSSSASYLGTTPALHGHFTKAGSQVADTATLQRWTRTPTDYATYHYYPASDGIDPEGAEIDRESFEEMLSVESSLLVTAWKSWTHSDEGTTAFIENIRFKPC